MTDNMRAPVLPRWVAVVMTVMVIALGVQSLFLFRVWQAMPCRQTGVRCDKQAATGCARGGDPVCRGRRTPSVRRSPGHTFFDDDDAFWKGFDSEGWDPFDELKHMRERMNSLFDDSFGRFSLSPGASRQGDALLGFAPQLDLKEKDDCYVASMDIPGADKNDISVKLDDRMLTVSGRINESTEKKDGDQILRKERRSGTFERTVTLPGPVVADKLDAHYENGVLNVTIPKAKEAKSTQTIPVK